MLIAICSFITSYPFVHSLTHSPTYPFTHASSYSLTHAFIHLLLCFVIYPCTHALTHAPHPTPSQPSPHRILTIMISIHGKRRDGHMLKTGWFTGAVAWVNCYPVFLFPNKLTLVMWHASPVAAVFNSRLAIAAELTAGKVSCTIALLRSQILGCPRLAELGLSGDELMHGCVDVCMHGWMNMFCLCNCDHCSHFATKPVGGMHSPDKESYLIGRIYM